MATFIRRHFWLLTGMFLLLSTLVVAGTRRLGVEVEQAQVHSALRVKLPDSVVAHESQWSLHPRAQPAPMPTPRVATVPTAPPVQAQAVRAVGEHVHALSRAEVADAFSRLEELAQQARVVPAFKDGQPQGFKLFAVRPGSIYEKLGLQSGDIVQRINGLSLNNPERAMEAYAGLRDAQRVEVDLERQGVPVRKVYSVR